MPPDLTWTQWTPAEIRAAAEAALTAKREQLIALKAIPAADRTFTNTIGAMERIDDPVSDIIQRLELLQNVHPDPALRQVAQETVEYMTNENIALAYDRDLYRAVTEWQAHDERLDHMDRKLANETIRDFKRLGFHLPDDQFERLKTLGQELQQLESAFERTINDYEDHIAVSREQLEGLPERYIASLKKDSEGKYLVTLQYPDLFPFLLYAHDENARRELSHKKWRRGGQENMERLAAMIRLRQEHARILGYASHADYVTEVRMAGTGRAAQAFIGDLISKLAPKAQQELRELVAVKKRTLKLEHPAPIYHHETGYWSNILRKERYDLDTEKVREYLPTEHVLGGILDIYQSILGLKFSPVPDVKLWHEDVRLFQVADATGNAVLGYFALDLYPRKGKYGHAAAFPITTSRLTPDGTQVPGMVALVCNFPKPTPDVPSLLSHDETETLFHEFGHVMHALVSASRWQRQNGFFVAMDFIEALSQIFEYWAWDPTVLARITKHYKTGEQMPAEMVARLIAARRHMEGSFYLAQALSAFYDLYMHMQATDAPVSADEFAKVYRELHFKYTHIELPDDAIHGAGWGHMADYDAGYYGYLWSKVYAADMFTRFAKDPLDVAVGTEYRAQVLGPGASLPEKKLVEDFLGRPSNSTAFLEELGIS